MKAIVYTKYGPPDVVQLQEVEKPAPKEDEVLVKVHAASVNALDWHMLTADIFLVRLMGEGLFKPKNTRLGADMAGRVEVVGSLVKEFQPGDVSAEAGVLRFTQPVTHQSDEEDIRCQQMPVKCIDGCGINLHQDFIVLGGGFFYLFELEYIRGSVFCMDYGFHRYSWQGIFRQCVSCSRMILPDMQLLLTPFASLHLQMMNSPLSMLKLMQINNFTQQQGLPISA